MRKIVSQIAGAVAVVSAATFAFAQTNDQNVAGENRSAQPRTAAPAGDLKANSTDSRFGPGGNNGSVYTPAIRSTDIKAGNVSNVEDPVATKVPVATPAAPAPAMTATPEPAPVDVAPAVTAAPEPMPAPAVTTTDTYDRPARADRN